MALTATNEAHIEPRPLLLFIFLGTAVLSLIASFSLLAAAVIIH